jgi:hypothetical protein
MLLGSDRGNPQLTTLSARGGHGHGGKADMESAM